MRLRSGALSDVEVLHALRWLFGAVLLLRLLYPFFNSPLDHLFSDPARHWNNGLNFQHPDILGSGDPYLYQPWLFLLQRVTQQSAPGILLGCGLLCALMPYGWYRALREVIPKQWALAGAALMGLVPSFMGIYGYFMNETLLLTLTGFAFWLTFRAYRKGTVGAFACACVVWFAAGFTRIVVWPIAILCLLWLLSVPPSRWLKLLAGGGLLALIAVPAGLHGRENLGYFSPFGNLYLNELYHDSGKKTIELDFGPKGRFWFGSPSFYNPTFYPFSDWMTDREGVVSATINTGKGRADWESEIGHVRLQRTLPRWLDFRENLVFLSFGQAWPDNDRNTLVGWLTVWTRWLWPFMALVVLIGVLRRRFRGREWLLPVCALTLCLLLAIQRQGVMEGRFRKPLEPILLAAMIVLVYRLWASRDNQVDATRL
ncbi:MAG: hypothetical protein ABJD53_12570 [Gammaproteobacteria bacterium]